MQEGELNRVQDKAEKELQRFGQYLDKRYARVQPFDKVKVPPEQMIRDFDMWAGNPDNITEAAQQSPVGTEELIKKITEMKRRRGYA